jgi:hypothetical protein
MAPELGERVPPTMTSGHLPVLLREVLAFLSPQAAGRYLDCTFGGAGTREKSSAPRPACR